MLPISWRRWSLTLTLTPTLPLPLPLPLTLTLTLTLTPTKATRCSGTRSAPVGSSTGGRGAAYALCSAADRPPRQCTLGTNPCFMVDDDRMAHIQVVEALEEIPFPYNSSVPS